MVKRKVFERRKNMRIATDIACIVALLLIPDFLLEKLGIYESTQEIVKKRKEI